MTDDFPSLPFSPEEVELLIGQTVLVGLTVLDSRDAVVEHRQFHGRIESIDPESGVNVRRADTGELEWLPADRRAYNPGEPGEYRLKGSGEWVTDPDLVATWTLYTPDDGD